MTTAQSEVFLERLQKFAYKCQQLTLNLSKTSYNLSYSNQLIRSSSSPGANYIEAIEASSRKDFIHRLRICRKECKESIYWLELIQFSNNDAKTIHSQISKLKSEAIEFIKIFTSSILTAEKKILK